MAGHLDSANTAKPTTKFPKKKAETKATPGSIEKLIETLPEPASKPQQISRKPAARPRKKAKKIREDTASD